MSYASLKMQGFSQLFPYVLISMLYVQSMHILAHLTGSKADQYNDPERATFYSKYSILLSILALAAGSAGLVIAFTLGLFPFMLLLILSLLGLSYNLRLVPEQDRYNPPGYPGSDAGHTALWHRPTVGRSAYGAHISRPRTSF